MPTFMFLIQDMSQSDIEVFKKYWKQIIGVCVVLCAIITFIFNATQVWDTKVAKKSDIEHLDTAIMRLSVSINDMKQAQQLNRVIAKSMTDSIDNKINYRLDNLEAELKKRHKYYLTNLVGFKLKGPQGPTTFESRKN